MTSLLKPMCEVPYFARANRLTLALFVLRVLTNHHDATAAANNATLFTDLLD